MIGVKTSRKAHTVGQKLGMAINTVGQKLLPLAHSNVAHIVSPALNIIEAHKSNSSALNYLPMGLKHKEKSSKSNLEK
jgi:hypothetical protein